MANEPSPPSLPEGFDKASLTEVVPVFSHKIHLFRNKFLIPGLMIAVASVLFLWVPLTATTYVWLLADYLMLTLFCIVYFYSEIDRPLSLYIVPALIIFAIMQVPMWLYPVKCPTTAAVCGRSASLWYGIYYAFDAFWQDILLKVVGAGNATWQNIVAMIAQPGLREEFVKAIPALLGAGLTLAEVPTIFILAILLPPVGLLVNGQRAATALNIVLMIVCTIAAFAAKFYPLLLVIPLQAVVAVALHRRRHVNAKPSRLHELLRVRDPLDGLMIGVASGLMFTLLENMFQYIPQQGSDVLKTTGGTPDLAFLAELLLLIPRSLDSIVAHFGWAGISGYFIGLIVLRPKGWPVLLAIGWLLPALLHGLFDGLLASNLNWWVLPLDIVSFILFLGCLLKARQLHMSLYAESVAAHQE
ncbi:MAG: PrsW family glutamic-type intramembrane protease [Methylovirgula sp.]